MCINDLIISHTALIKSLINKSFALGYLDPRSIDKEDVFQTVCLGLVPKLKKYNPKLGKVSTYIGNGTKFILMGINRTISRRKRKLHQVDIDPSIFFTMQKEDPDLINQEVHSLINSLDKVDREIIMRYYFQHHTMEVIGKSLGVSRQAIHSHIKKILKKLRVSAMQL